MRKLTSLMVLMTILAVMTVSAVTTDDSHIWTDVYNGGGYTEYTQQTWIGGYDWSEQSNQMTAVIQEGLVNDGSFEMHGVLSSYAPWELEEMKVVNGTGYTKLYKTVTVWTEDSRESGGSLRWPTQAWIAVNFETDTVNDWTTAYFLMDQPPAETLGIFSKTVLTDDDFRYSEHVGINTFDCNYVPPTKPVSPTFCCD